MKLTSLHLACGALLFAACSGSPSTASTSSGSGASTGAASSGASGGASASTSTTSHSAGTSSGSAATGSSGSAATGSNGGSTGAASGTQGSTGSSAATSSGSASAGTTGSFASGADGGLCALPDGGLVADGGGTPDFQQCNSNADCLCPEICANDPTVYSTILGAGSGLICTTPCHTTNDCPDPQTSCQAGACLTNICAADAGPYFGACNAAGIGDGTCLPSFDANSDVFGECLQSGSATSDCNPLATRLSGDPLCVPGTVCSQTLDGGRRGVCQLQCDPTLSAGPGSAMSVCGAGQLCSGAIGASGETLYVPTDTPHSGECYPAGPGGCALDLPSSAPTELQTCTSNADCGCPQSCVLDPGQGLEVCELPCTSTSADCPNDSTSCQSGFCGLDYCNTTLAGAAAPGSFDQPCNAAGTGDGTCLAEVQNLLTLAPLPYAYGLCVQAGSLATGTTCDQTIDLRDAGALCHVGSQCITYDQNGDNACLALCNPVAFFGAAADGGPECPAGDGCFGLWSDQFPGEAVSYGACNTCTADGGFCGTASECCAPFTCSDAGPTNGFMCQ